MTVTTPTKVGRPTTYNQEIGDEICNTVACTSQGIRKLCKANKHWPSAKVIYDWRRKNNVFGEQYVRAKEHQVEALVDEMLDIADDTSNDSITREDGRVVANNEYINRSRLRIDTRKWLAAKLCPRLYGDKAADAKPGACESLIEKLHAKNLLDGFNMR